MVHQQCMASEVVHSTRQRHAPARLTSALCQDTSLRIAVNCGWGKRRHTHGNILGTLWGWRAIAHPLATVDDNGLTGSNSVNALASLDLKLATHNDCELVKIRCLARLTPARWTDHACDARALGI